MVSSGEAERPSWRKALMWQPPLFCHVLLYVFAVLLTVTELLCASIAALSSPD